LPSVRRVAMPRAKQNEAQSQHGRQDGETERNSRAGRGDHVLKTSMLPRGAYVVEYTIGPGEFQCWQRQN